MKKNFLLMILLIICFVVAAVIGGITLSKVGGQTKPEVPEDPSQTGEPAVTLENIFITEICASNKRIITDEYGKHPDYIELWNAGETEFDLTGYMLSDGKNTTKGFEKTVLAPDARLVIFLGPYHGAFSLSSKGGETLRLINPKGQTVIEVIVCAMDVDEVMSWDGKDFVLTTMATPGAENTEEAAERMKNGIRAQDPKLVISEILNKNKSVLPDENGKFSDVVELHNISNEMLEVSGWYLSDREDDKLKYALPALTLEPDGYLTVFCDGGGYVAKNGTIHAGFSVSIGETVYLTNLKNEYVCAEVFQTSDNASMLLTSDGTWVEGEPSPGFVNSSEGVVQFLESRIDYSAPLIVSEVMLSADGTIYNGFYYDVVEITNRSKEAVSLKGWYLSDSSDLFKYALPDETLKPGEYTVFICTNGEGEHFTGFALSELEQVTLTGPNMMHGVQISCASAGGGRSWNLADLTEDTPSYVSEEPSPGYENSDRGCTAFLESSVFGDLRLNEAMSLNTKYLKGSYGTTADWIELYNASDKDISLKGYYLTDDNKNLKLGALPDVILKAGEYYVVFASADSTNLLSDYAVVPFGLSYAGETVYLTNGENILDIMALPKLDADVSFGRPEGKMAFSILESPTPGKTNSEGIRISNPPSPLTAQGVYNGVDYIDVELEGSGKIYYTLDCTSPTASSEVYSGPIRLTKTTVVRAVCIEDGCQTSDVLSLTYVINEGHTIAVASLVTDPDNLWDYKTGIYATGPNASSEFPYVGANYWQSWEREATVSLFEDSGMFSVQCGIKIFGAYSRALPQKSICCHFRAEYGDSSLVYPLFGEEGLDEYQAFVFRNTGQDYSSARMRDVLISGLTASGTDVLVQKYKPCILYLNGEYWGVYFIREKINENYVAGNCNVKPEEVTIARAEGLNVPIYKELITYVKNHSLSSAENYRYVCSLVDVEEFADYLCAQIYCANTDNGNIRFFKTTEGKWTWIMFDVDHGFKTSYWDAVSDHLNPNGTGSMDRFPTTLRNALLKNSDFKAMFLKKMATQMNTIWTVDNVLAEIDRLAGILDPEMERDRERWTGTYSGWLEKVDELRYFAKVRPGYMIKHIKAYFNLNDEQMKAYGFQIS